MITFFQSLANLIDTIVQFVINGFESVINVFNWVGISISYIMACLSFLPSFVRVPILAILTIILAKLVLSLGKQ